MPTAVGAYIFAGGFTVGVRDAGFTVLAHLEGDGYGASTARLNFPEMPVHVGKSNWPLADLANVDLIFCNPPCAPWSANGVRSQGKVRGMGAWRSDPRVSCWRDCFELLVTLRPRAWVCESVTGVYSDGRDMIDEYTRRGLLLGYSVTHVLLDARWCGLPQARKRFFLIFHRQPKLVGYQHNWAPAPTVGEVLATVSEPGAMCRNVPRHDVLLPHARPGESLAATWARVTPPERQIVNPATGKMTGRPFASNRRLPLDRPMGAYTGNILYHPTLDRQIGIEEAKAICGYPPEFVFDGPVSAHFPLLARAVMPPVGRWIARAILTTLAGPVVNDRRELRVTLVDVREPDVAPTDLTPTYLNADGRVILRGDDVRLLQPITPGVTPIAPPRPARRPVPAVAQVVPAPQVASRVQGGAVLPREGSGAFLRRLWMTGLYAHPGGPEELVALVHANWTGRTTSVSDVRYNYQQLIAEHGRDKVPPWPRRRPTAPPAVQVSAPVAPPTPLLSSGDVIIAASVAAYLAEEDRAAAPQS